MANHSSGNVQTAPDINDYAEMFELAPVSLWLEDYSALKALFATWRAEGVTDLRAYFAADTARVRQCSACIRLIKVNRTTLTLYEAKDAGHLIANLGLVLRDDMLTTHVDELVQLWEDKLQFRSNTVNYTLSGKRLDIQLHGRVLPGYEETWERVLVAIEDVTERENARRKLSTSENYAFGLFAHSPVSLWVEDFSEVKKLLDEIRDRGISDFRVFTDVHPEFVSRCMSEIRVLDVNRRTLELFAAADRAALLRSLRDVFRDDMETHFREQLIDLWDGKLFQLREVVNYALDGTKLNLLLQFSVLPGHERDWSLVQVALTDITARKKAEAYLEYLGTHDVLTKLFNRSFYVDELNRLERKGPHPVSIIMADLNGLKAVNDELGHAAGDQLLRRAGEVLNSLIEKPAHAARIGGDEFAVLMPETDEVAAETVIQAIHELVAINNTFYPDLALSLSMGSATAGPGERMEHVVKRADLAMLDAKRTHYVESQHDRRRPVGGAPSIAVVS
jgi:diguanylate cyclase (GGDEF)-like protein